MGITLVEAPTVGCDLYIHGIIVGNATVTNPRCTGTAGDTLTVRFYDWDNQEIGVITFKKQ